jgi:hypothetical protein
MLRGRRPDLAFEGRCLGNLVKGGAKKPRSGYNARPDPVVAVRDANGKRTV